MRKFKLIGGNLWVSEQVYRESALGLEEDLEEMKEGGAIAADGTKNFGMEESISINQDVLCEDHNYSREVVEAMDVKLLLPQRHFDANVERLLRAQGAREYVELYGKYKGLEGMVMLSAHGFDLGREWGYEDGREEKKVQNWVSRNDGKYSALLLAVCNPDVGYTPKTKKSLLVLADKGYGASCGRDGASVNIVSPERGNITEERMERELENLKLFAAAKR